MITGEKQSKTIKRTSPAKPEATFNAASLSNQEELKNKPEKARAQRPNHRYKLL